MTNPHLPFLRAIIAAPADDLPRLIYADWLDETAGKSLCRACKGTGGTWEPQCCIPCHGTGFVSNGHAERAEFIRVQCRLDAVYDDRERDGKGKWRLDDGASLDEYRAIRRRERELLSGIQDRIREEWRKPGDDVWWRTWTFRRGFVEHIECSWSDFRTHAAAIRERTPLRKVRLTDWPELGEVTADERRHVREVWPFEYEPDRIAILQQRYPGLEFELPQQRSEWYDANLPEAERIRRAGPLLQNTTEYPPGFPNHLVYPTELVP